MNLTFSEVLLGGFVAVAAGVALWAGPNLAVAAPSAAAAIGAALVLAVIGFMRQVRLPGGADQLGEYDSLVLLRQAFSKGLLGRQAIVSSIAGLEGELLHGHRQLLTLEDEERLRLATPRQFREWVDGRLDELERVS